MPAPRPHRSRCPACRGAIRRPSVARCSSTDSARTRALMWRFGVALADAGWHADAVDLRGHGTRAARPGLLDRRRTPPICAATRPGRRPGLGPRGRPLARRRGGDRGGGSRPRRGPTGSCSSIRRSTSRPATATSCARARSARSPTRPIAAVRAEHPHWHQHDVELKALSARQASRWAVEQTSVQNAAWDVRDAASRLTVPTHVIGVGPEGVLDLHGSAGRGGADQPGRSRCRSSPVPGTRRTATSRRPRSRSS